MTEFPGQNFIDRVVVALNSIPQEQIMRAAALLQAAYERGGRIYIFGNGGSFAIATHWASDFNKKIFSRNRESSLRRFQAVRLPMTDAELTAWANDVSYDTIFATPLENCIEERDIVIAISSSGASVNIIKAVEVAKNHNVPVVGLSGFDGGKLNELADAKVLVATAKGEYGVVETVHVAILHLITEYFMKNFERATKPHVK